MRRDYFDAEVRNVDDDRDVPVVSIAFDGPSGALAERLATDDGPLDAASVDVTYRHKAETKSGDPGGVLSVANRLTGAFILETNVDPDAIDWLVETARFADGSDETSYRVRITDAEGKSTVYDKETLLVYDADGSLLRQESLIPGGVEL